jgi:hypothetical protein
LRHNGRKKKKQNVLYIYIYYKEFPREEDSVDFDDEQLCPQRLRGINDKHKSRDEGYLSHSDCKH